MKTYVSSKYNIIIDENINEVTIYNSYRGGIVKLEKNLYDLISSDKTLEEIGEYAGALLEDGYIVSNDTDEYQRCKIRKEEKTLHPFPETITYIIAPTLNCNLNCIYCFEKNNRNNCKKNMSKEALDKTIDFILNNISNNPNLKNIIIHWFGGEPLLCYEEIIYFSQILKEKLKSTNINLYSQMTTNGVLLNAEKLETLVNEYNLMKIQITVDGEVDTYCKMKQTSEDVYKKVISNIILASKYTKTTIRLNADKNNYEELKKLTKTIYDLPIKKENIIIHLAQIRNYTDDKEMDTACFNDFEFYKKTNEFNNFLLELGYQINKENTIPSFTPLSYCGIRAKHNFVIDYNGDLYKCEHYLGESNKIVGDIKNGVYYNNEYHNSLTFAGNDKCSSCKLFPICNYAECSSMFTLTGETECKCYNDQLNVIKDKVREYIKENI